MATPVLTRAQWIAEWTFRDQSAWNESQVRWSWSRLDLADKYQNKELPYHPRKPDGTYSSFWNYVNLTPFP